jgi:hypothetical protein
MKRTKKRLLDLLDQRDRQIAEMSETIERLEREADGSVWSEWLPREVVDDKRLPVPRLEIEIVQDHYPDGAHAGIVYIYRLVYRHLTGILRSIPLGRTTSSGTMLDDWPPWLNGDAHWPFRDGAHIHHDATHLDLPGFLRCGDDYIQLDPAAFAHQSGLGKAHQRPLGSPSS